jgi:D-alanine-D-alanine ligase
VTPAEVPDDVVAERIRELAGQGLLAAGLRGLARVDFFLTEERRRAHQRDQHDARLHPDSMYPRMWAETGVPYDELVDELITLALERRVGLR